MQAARLFATVSVAGANASAAALRGFGGQVASTQKGLNRIAGGAGQMAGGFARLGAAAAGAAVGGLGLMAKASINFEDAFAGVKKTVDETDLTKAGLSFESLRQTFLKMSTEMPISASELAGIGEAAGALGVRAQDIANFTAVVAKLGVTTNLSTQEAGDSLGKLGSILGFTGNDYRTFADSLVNLGNKGASTEAEIIEITKRFAAQGKQAGLATTDILALSSAAASLGIEPEAAGGALSRVFANMASDIALATDEGKTFAKITGKSLKDLTEDIRNGKGLEIYLDFLKTLGKMDRVDASKALVGVGLTDTRNRNAVLLMAQNIGLVNTALIDAKDSTGALETEATKKFDTVKAKVTELKNTFIKAGIDAGDGFLPALGRISVKAKDFVNAHTEDFKKFGRDVGAALDGVDWAKVAAGGEAVVDVARGILDIVAKIPPEVTAIGAAFLGVNKITGGLLLGGAGNVLGGLTDVVGGLARAAGAGAKGTGAAGALSRVLAQPVFVTNWPLGGVGGGGVPGAAGPAAGAAGGVAGLLKTGAKLAGGVGIAIIGIEALGELVKATSTPGQLATSEQNFINDNRRKRGGNGILGGSAAAQPAPPLGPVTTGLLDRGGREMGGATGKERDDRLDSAQLLRGTNALLSDGFRQMLTSLKGAKGDTAIAAAMKTAIDTVVTRQKGDVKSTQLTLDGLKGALKNTSDPQLRSALKDAIGKVERKLIGREWIQRQIDKADAILRSNESSKAKLVDLAAIQRTLRDRGDTHAAALIGQKIDAEKAAVTAASRAAGQEAAFAIRDKEMSTKVTIGPTQVYVTASVGLRETIKTQTTAKKLGNVYIS